MVAIINWSRWVFRVVWQYIKNLRSASEATLYADISCNLKLNWSRNSLPDVLLTPCRRDMYVDDACTLAVNFKWHHNQLKVYLRKCQKTLFNGRIWIQVLLNTSFRRVCIEMKSRKHNMHVEQRKFRAHGICVEMHGTRCEDVVKKASMKTSWRCLDRSGRRLEGSPEDVPLDYGFNCSRRCEDVLKKSSMNMSGRRLHRYGRRLEGSPKDVPLVNGFNCSQRCEDVFKKSSMKTYWRRLHRSWRRLEGSPEDVPVVTGFNCSQRCEDILKTSSMKTS